MFILARSGWSKQGGFELYLQDGKRGIELWNIVKAAGMSYGIRAGAPNDKERIESGLVSYGADGRLQTNPCNPFEISLGKFVNFNKEDDFVGRAALLKIKAEGPKRRRVGYVISCDAIPASQHSLDVVNSKGEVVGILSEWIYSERFGSNVGVGMIINEIIDISENLNITWEGQPYRVKIKELPFIKV